MDHQLSASLLNPMQKRQRFRRVLIQSNSPLAGVGRRVIWKMRPFLTFSFLTVLGQNRLILAKAMIEHRVCQEPGKLNRKR